MTSSYVKEENKMTNYKHLFIIHIAEKKDSYLEFIKTLNK